MVSREVRKLPCQLHTCSSVVRASPLPARSAAFSSGKEVRLRCPADGCPTKQFPLSMFMELFVRLTQRQASPHWCLLSEAYSSCVSVLGGCGAGCQCARLRPYSVHAASMHLPVRS